MLVTIKLVSTHIHIRNYLRYITTVHKTVRENSYKTLSDANLKKTLLAMLNNIFSKNPTDPAV